MMKCDVTDSKYKDEETERLETIRGKGFLSPGGPAEVSRVLGKHNIEGSDILDIGSGTGGVKEVTGELEKMRGPLQTQMQEEIEFWEIMVSALKEGAIMPGHIRAMKPA